MRMSTLTVALVSALLIAGTGAGGALAATGSLQAQQSSTDTTDTGTSSGTETTTAGADGGTTAGASGPSVTFNDQNSSGETVLIQSATLPQNGFVAIYDSSRSNNETEQVIGGSYLLNAGTSDNIRIQLDESLNQTKSLTAVVHTDSNGNGQFDFVSSNGQQDPPLTQGDRRVVDIATVTVQGGDAGGTNPTESGGATDASGATAADGGTQTAAGGGSGTAADAGNASGGNESGGGDGSGAFGPGFGLAVAVVTLLAIALLAVRRN